MSRGPLSGAALLALGCCAALLFAGFTALGVWQLQRRVWKLELIERLQVAELMLRLSMDKRLISKTAYAQAIELTTSIGKQANGWRRAAHRPLHGGQGRHD